MSERRESDKANDPDEIRANHLRPSLSSAANDPSDTQTPRSNDEQNRRRLKGSFNANEFEQSPDGVRSRSWKSNDTKSRPTDESRAYPQIGTGERGRISQSIQATAIQATGRPNEASNENNHSLESDDMLQRTLARYVREAKNPRLPIAAVDVVLASELLPRLLMAHRVRNAPNEPDVKEKTVESLSEADRRFFKNLILEEVDGSAVDFLTSLVVRGIPSDQIVFDLFGDTARQLGQLWDSDELDFATVTIGLCNLHKVMRNQEWSSRDAGVRKGSARPSRKALLTTLNGDQHIFGLYAVAEAFRREGWIALTAAGAGKVAVAAMLADEYFDVAAISASCDFDTQMAAKELAGYRSASKNKDLKIIVGGPAFGKDCEAVYNVGADGWSREARDAPAAAGALLDDLIERI
ncbi:MAG: cobalamin B12-binding domain-containing protein [Pseudomonadota bacterium]